MDKTFLGIVCYVFSVAFMTGCSGSRTTISASSDQDLAALHDATTGESVTLCYRDTLTNFIVRTSADDLIVTAHSASWTQGTEGMKTISTGQIVSITCVGCKRFTVEGSCVGGLLGSVTGYVFGGVVDSPQVIVKKYPIWDRQEIQSPQKTTNYTPAFTIIGGLIGTLIGGSAGANAERDETWHFEP